jgi:hypothetical protein
VTVERDQALSRTAEWLDKVYQCIVDTKGDVELPDGVISQPPGSRHVASEETGEGFRELLLQLEDRVLPDVEAELPDLVEAFTELRKRLLALGNAIYGPRSEFDSAVGGCRSAWREANQAVRGEAAPASPRVPATPKSETRRPKLKEGNCAQCGGVYEPPRDNSVYCSDACRQKAHREGKKQQDQASLVNS